jgi:hypothetical protein
MSVRLSLLAVATLALSACDGTLPAPAQQAACCCRQCPTDAAPAAKGQPVTADAGPAVQADAGGERVAAYRVRTGPRVRREGGSGRYEGSGEDLYGGRYGGRYGGVSVSVEESESSSERYSYSESSSGYGSSSASGGGYAYASGGGYRDGRVSRDPRHHPGYRLAGTDEDGYLTWPGKVED